MRRRVFAFGLTASLLLQAVLLAAERPDDLHNKRGEDMPKEETPLVPRRSFFGNPDRMCVQISPNGSHLSWCAALNGVMNVWVAPRDALDAARPVTHDTGRGIRWHTWAFNNTHVLYSKDNDGDENWHLHSVDIASGEARDLTPIEGVRADMVERSRKSPDEIFVGLNDRDPKWHDLYRINVVTGERSLVLRNDSYIGGVLDNDYCFRFGVEMKEEGGLAVYALNDEGRQLWDTVPPEDAQTTHFIGFDETNRFLQMEDSRGRNTSALIEADAETGEKRVLAADERSDVSDTVRHPAQKNIQAVAFTHERKRWEVLDKTIEPDMAFLRTVADGDIEIADRALDDRFWVVCYLLDDGPARFYLYDRETRDARFLFTNRQALEGLPLVKMLSAVIKSRDGLDLVVYYSLPAGSDRDSDGLPDRPLPMVFIPHGGPWHRDVWGYNSWHQWLANRGYAVLSVNFRSSTGFGKDFINAGDREWGGKIREDQVDAVQWAVEKKIADQKRVAVMGGSFGGYSTLAGLTFTPEFFACGVDIVGISNLITFIESIPPYWKPMQAMLDRRVGGHNTEEGRALLKKHSPLTYAGRICRPLLIAQGANDPRVKQAESDQIVQTMQAKDIPVTYALFPDEGHGFARPENSLAFHAVAEAFLAECLGGRFEPIGNDFDGSTIQVPAGAELVPGLAEALKAKEESRE